MLIRSKNKNEKIVWGLLSYTFEEEMTSSEQRHLLETYRENSHCEIFLYREEEQDNFVGVIVVEMSSDVSECVDSTIEIQKVSVVPSFRHEGIGYKIYKELRQLYPQASIKGSLQMSEIVKNWSIKYRQELNDESNQN